LQLVYDSLMNSQAQVHAWFEEATLVVADAPTKTEELLDCAADIKQDWKRYWEIMNQLPNVGEFSEEELETRSGKADQLFYLSWEVMLIKTHFPCKIDKLRFLLEHPTQ
jgi:hypothetical protein